MKFSLPTLLCIFIVFFSNALYAQEQQTPKVSFKDILEKENQQTEMPEQEDLSFEYDVPEDKYNRGQPRASFEGFLLAAKNQDFARAIEFLDFRNVKENILSVGKEELARQLYVVLGRTLWIDTENISIDPLGNMHEKNIPSYRDLIGTIATKQGKVKVFLQRVPRIEDRVNIWKISNATVNKIPLLDEEYAYTPLGEWLSKNLPSASFLGVLLWQWVYFFYMFFVFFLIAKVLTWLVSKLLVVAYPKLSLETQTFIKNPLALLLSVVFLRILLPESNATLASKAVSEGATLLTLAWLWVLFRFVDLMKVQMAERFIKQDKPLAIFLLRPAGTVIKSFIAIVTALIWFENLGFSATTLLTGLGIGGLAIALAAQKTVENIIGAITLYTSAPVKIGDFCRIGKYLGVVEEIGLRATRIRTIDRTVIYIANAKFIDMEIENFSEREKMAFRSKVYLMPDSNMDNINALVNSLREYFATLESLSAEPQRAHIKACTYQGIEINILVYVKTINFDVYLDEINQLNLTILSLLKQHDCQLQVTPIATAGLSAK
jgi:MscS family membrane protein